MIALRRGRGGRSIARRAVLVRTELAVGLALIASLTGAVSTRAQEFTRRARTPAQIDSMVAVAEQRVLPFFAEGVARRGIDLPLPVGVTVHSYSQVQPTRFSDLRLGLGGDEMLDADFVVFDDAVSQVWSPQLRLDAWLLPFLNVYGLLGPAHTNTEVLMTEPFPLVIRTDIDAFAYGLGGSLNGGWQQAWITVTTAFAWTDVPNLTELVNATSVGLRVGTNLGLGRVRKSLSVWVGANYQTIEGETAGVVRPAGIPGAGNGPVVEFVGGGYQGTDWYQGLPPAERIAADAFFTRLAGLDVSEWTFEYAVVKAPVEEWNGTVGAQVDLTRAWHFMVEAGVLGARKSLNVSLSYRFAL